MIRRIWTKSKKAFKNIDSLGSNVELTIQGSKTFKTYIGSLLTLAVFAVVCWYSSTVVSRVLDRTSPAESLSTQYDISAARTELSESQLIPVLNIFNKSSFGVLPFASIEKITTIKARVYRSYFNFALKKLVNELVEFPVVQCSLLKNKKPYQAIYEDPKVSTLWSNMACIEIPDSEIFIYGDRMTQDFQSFNIEFHPCSLPNPSDCINGAELGSLMITAGNSKHYLQNSDFDNPIKYDLHLTEELNLQMNIGTVMFSFARENKIVDNTNWLQPKHENVSYSDIFKEQSTTFQRSGTYCTPLAIATYQCQFYLQISFRHSGVTTEATRTYPNLVDAMSDVGGFKEVLLLVIGFIYAFYNDVFMGRYLIEKIIPSGTLASLVKDSKDLTDMARSLKNRPQSYQADAKNEDQGSWELSPTLKKLNVHDENIVTPGPFQEQGKINKELFGDSFKMSNDSGSNQRKPTKMKVSDLKSEFSSIIESLMDIDTIIRELSSWRVFKDIVFEDYQKQILPLIQIENNRKQRNADEAMQEREKNIEKGAGSKMMQNIVSSMASNMDLKESLGSLTKHLQSSHMRDNSLRYKIDLYFARNLPEFEDESPGADSRKGGSTSVSPANNRPAVKQFEVSSFSSSKPIDYGNGFERQALNRNRDGFNGRKTEQ